MAGHEIVPTTLPAGAGGWWSSLRSAPACSAELAAYAAVDAAAAVETRSRMSAESPAGSVSNSSVSFQDSAAFAVPPSPAVIAADWNQPFISCTGSRNHVSDGGGHHAYQPHNFQLGLFDDCQSTLLASLMEAPPPPPVPAAPTKVSPFLQQAPGSRLQFTNDTPFWNPAAAAPESSFFNCPAAFTSNSMNLHIKSSLEGAGDSTSTKSSRPRGGGGEPAFKKPRVDGGSPAQSSSSTTFIKARKEKLGDRITALQQLVSPFGKTDTASVLHETIEYIKFLHDQVGALSESYLKSGQVQQFKINEVADMSKLKADLRSRGLCLVPMASTFAVADVPMDFWNSPFSGVFR